MRTTIAHGKSRYQQKDSTLWGLASTWEMRLTGPIPRPERTLTLGEIERVGRGAKHITVEAYRSEREKVNLMYWQLTCRAFHTPAEWRWAFEQAGYSGDFGCIYFE